MLKNKFDPQLLLQEMQLKI